MVAYLEAKGDTQEERADKANWKLVRTAKKSMVFKEIHSARS